MKQQTKMRWLSGLGEVGGAWERLSETTQLCAGAPIRACGRGNARGGTPEAGGATWKSRAQSSPVSGVLRLLPGLTSSYGDGGFPTASG